MMKIDSFNMECDYLRLLIDFCQKMIKNLDHKEVNPLSIPNQICKIYYDDEITKVKFE